MVSQLDNHDFRLLPNTNVNVTIVMAQHDNVLVIPREALRLDDSKPYVYQIVDNKLHKQNVAVATSNLTKVEVSQGLTDKKPDRAQYHGREQIPARWHSREGGAVDHEVGYESICSGGARVAGDRRGRRFSERPAGRGSGRRRHLP